MARVLEPELARRRSAGAAPWLRTKTRARESEALIRTLNGHTGGIRACAISPDGSFVVSASWDMDGQLTLEQFRRMLGNYLTAMDVDSKRLKETMQSGRDPSQVDLSEVLPERLAKEGAGLRPGGSLPPEVIELLRKLGKGGGPAAEEEKKKVEKLRRAERHAPPWPGALVVKVEGDFGGGE